jgi:hypothetical protein
MHFKRNMLLILPLLILALSLTTCINLGFCQFVSVDIEVPDLRELDQRLNNFETLKEIAAKQTAQIEELTNALKTANDTIALSARENELNAKILAIKDQEIAAQARAIADLRDISDRAIKLAEAGKPSSKWWMIPVSILAGIVVGIGLMGGL